MKTPVPVTLDDLEATAKDDKAGQCFYGYVKVYWDDANNSFSYWVKGNPFTRMTVEAYLKKKDV